MQFVFFHGLFLLITVYSLFVFTVFMPEKKRLQEGVTDITSVALKLS